MPENSVSPPRPPLSFSAISRIDSPRRSPYRVACCNAANLPFGGLELFYEILYNRDNHASGRRGNRICAETNAPSARGRATQGTDSGNDRTRTFARDAHWRSFPFGNRQLGIARVKIARQLQLPQDAHRRRRRICLFQPDRGREERPDRHLPAALFDEGAAREPAAQRGRPLGHQGRHPGDRRLARPTRARPASRSPIARPAC